MIFVLLFLAACFLAYSNGANDNFKGVASLYGSRTASYRTALTWATIMQFAGSITSIFLAQALLKKFSGKGLVPDTLVASEHFLLAVALGAALTVILATVTGFPVSTTHAITGALVGCGFLAVGSGVNFAALQKGFLLPLLLSPVVAIALAALVYLVLRLIRISFGVEKEWCACVGTEERVLVMPQPASAIARQTIAPEYSVMFGESTVCAERYRGSMVGVNAQQIMDGAHFLSAGVVCFARALNDTPKIVAVLLILKALDLSWGFLAIAGMMTLGGLIQSRKIAETMSKKITGMNHGQGFAANLCTGILVIAASLFGLPVSTTHVAVGSLFGIGLTTGKANPKVMMGIVLSWLITLPCAALLGAIIYFLLKRIA
ncbi:MAG: inorganic phosphate transporter, PiT family [Verrucomicrobiota bacterium]|jgi:PiT family inorganic phosphate transporter